MEATGMSTRGGDSSAVLGEATIAEFRSGLRGKALVVGDPGYDEARTVYNAMIDRHPAVIARCAGAADVIHAIQFARSESLPISVRGGAHSVAGNAVCDG